MKLTIHILTTHIIVTAATVFTSFAAHATPPTKADQDALHAFFSGINNLSDGIDMAQGVQFDKPTDNSIKIARLLKPCTVTNSDDAKTNSSTTTLNGTACPMNYSEISTDTNTNPDTNTTDIQAQISDANLVALAGTKSMIQSTTASTASQANGVFHTDGSSRDTYAMNRTNVVTISDITHIDGVISKSSGGVDITINHLDMSGSVDYGPNKSVQMAMVLDTAANGNETINCSLNGAAADCAQLSYILALDDKSELGTYLSERLTDNIKEKFGKSVRHLSLGPISTEDQNFLHSFFAGSHTLDDGLNILLGADKSKASESGLKLATQLNSCKVVTSRDDKTQSSTSTFEGETCPVGFMASTIIAGKKLTTSSQFTTCDTNIQALSGIAREAYQFESMTDTNAGKYQSSTSSTTRYATTTGASIVVKQKIDLAGEAGQFNMSLTKFMADTTVEFNGKSVNVTAATDYAKDTKGISACTLDGHTVDCAQANYILDLSNENMSRRTISLAPQATLF
jgi:hypothetical protein